MKSFKLSAVVPLVILLAVGVIAGLSYYKSVQRENRGQSVNRDSNAQGKLNSDAEDRIKDLERQVKNLGDEVGWLRDELARMRKPSAPVTSGKAVETDPKPQADPVGERFEAAVLKVLAQKERDDQERKKEARIQRKLNRFTKELKLQDWQVPKVKAALKHALWKLACPSGPVGRANR